MAILFSAILIALAGVSDALDGYVARKYPTESNLGVALDPLCDKIFAIILIIGLIFYRQFPIWLALVIVSRDLLILLGGLLIKGGKDIELPSNLPGKYAFASIVVLLSCYVIKFSFGIELFIPMTIGFTIWSLLSYGRIFYLYKTGKIIKPYIDTKLTKVSRLVAVWIVTAIFFWKLFEQYQLF